MKKYLILAIFSMMLASCSQMQGIKVYHNNNFCNGADTYMINFDTRKVINITRYNYNKLDTSYGQLTWSMVSGPGISMYDRSPIYQELGNNESENCNSDYVYYLTKPGSILFYDDITEDDLILFGEFPWMTYKRVKDYKGKIDFK